MFIYVAISVKGGDRRRKAEGGRRKAGAEGGMIMKKMKKNHITDERMDERDEGDGEGTSRVLGAGRGRRLPSLARSPHPRLRVRVQLIGHARNNM